METATRAGSGAGGPRVEPNADEVPWVREGILAGVAGATVVALCFLVVDVLAGRPFWTPHALGAALFRGALPDPGEAIELVFVAGYTGIHGTVFSTVGLIAAFEVLARRRSAAPLRFLGFAGVLFVGIQLAFWCFDALLVTHAMATLGAAAVVLANALAALAMAATLRRRGAPASREP